MILQPTSSWKNTYPLAAIGVLHLSNLTNPSELTTLALEKNNLVENLRRQYQGMQREQIKALPVLQAYERYYRQFDKSYHVQLQLESILFKGKNIPSVAALVEAMFMAELKNMLLTAGHDAQSLKSPLVVDTAQGGETYTGINGKEVTLKPADMYIRDAQGILSSILYGPDQRSKITPETRSAVFTVYAPSGISEQTILQHLEDIRNYVLIINPLAVTENLNVVQAL